MVCEATLAPDLRVREAAFECLAGIASLHYNKLQPYITDIFNLTQQAINTGEEQVAKQAIEFWCTICDEELELRDEVRPCRPLDPNMTTSVAVVAAY